MTASCVEHGTSFESRGVVNEQVWFTPAVTIECKPPYVAGQRDICWVRYSPGQRPKTKAEWERRIGMSIQETKL